MNFEKKVEIEVSYYIEQIKTKNNEDFIKCPKCKDVFLKNEIKLNIGVCCNCNHHFRISCKERLESIFDSNSVTLLDEDIKSKSPLNFPSYTEKVQNLSDKLKLNDAVITGIGSINGIRTGFGIMDSSFMMGSMGSVVGEKLVRLIENSINLNLPVIIFTASGGARMQEGMLSLVQMAKVSAAIKVHSKKGLLYISVITDPTTGGVTASFASLGDIIIAEPNAMFGFAGKRVIEQTIQEKLPDCFQNSEFMIKNGFIDLLVQRRMMKETLENILLMHNPINIYAKNFSKQNTLKVDCRIDENNNLSAWEIVKIARNKERPNYKDYISLMIDNFIELHGDRYYGDDNAIVCGIGYINEIAVTIICSAKGKSVDENVQRNWGSAKPEGYRKALRIMKEAEKFKRPIICLIDTAGAYCGVEGEERGQGEAIAKNLLEMSDLQTPIISVVIGEGGSGGALALGVADRIFMLENSIYSVISPEGCAAILLKDSARANEAAELLKLTAMDLLKLNIIDGIIEEPIGGAHKDVEFTIKNVKRTIYENIINLKHYSITNLIKERYCKFRNMGVYME